MYSTPTPNPMMNLGNIGISHKNSMFITPTPSNKLNDLDNNLVRYPHC